MFFLSICNLDRQNIECRVDKKIEAKCRSKLEGGSFEREMEKDREKNNPTFF